MSKVKWVVEDFEPDNKFGALADEVKQQGMECEVIKYIPFQSGSYNLYDSDFSNCVIFQGSINLALQLNSQKKWLPGAWLSARNYECTTYYAYLGKYLFNDKYIILPRDEVKRRLRWLYDEAFGTRYQELFFRPSSGLKPFTASLVHELNFPSLWGWVEEFTDKESMIVISTPKNILNEWRFVVAEKEVITGCQYEKSGELNFQEGYSNKAKNLAETIAKEEFEPDPMYVIDICEGSDNNMYLLEINSFSCSGLYACELKPIVKKASEIAYKEWTTLGHHNHTIKDSHEYRS